ncbi:hypothetical protein AVEN_41449-1 [Araneus ventricosus]|uniref:Uncharacterized protein n=1 Tax=Araneus ventricosus TaxID=182803 RepID=A0A4Y2F2Y8_ARAVE|nr:hypothetical protein AVEN_41449-1 [Araneus ventricosus]
MDARRMVHGGSSVELGFEPGAVRSQSRGLIARPPRPGEIFAFVLEGNGLQIFFYKYPQVTSVVVKRSSTCVMRKIGAGFPQVQSSSSQRDTKSRCSYKMTLL